MHRSDYRVGERVQYKIGRGWGNGVIDSFDEKKGVWLITTEKNGGQVVRHPEAVRKAA